VLLKGDTPSTGTIALSELEGIPASSTFYKIENNKASSRETHLSLEINND
jgi:hypothetical protein